MAPPYEVKPAFLSQSKTVNPTEAALTFSDPDEDGTSSGKSGAVEVASPLPNAWNDRIMDWLSGYAPIVVGAWAAGLVIQTLRLAGGWLYLRRLIRLAIPMEESNWSTRLTRLAGQMQVRHSLQLLQSVWIEVPMVIGWLRPVILVPTLLLAGLDPSQMDALLAHELAHIRRHDYLVNFLQILIETFLFYHPVVWWIGRKLREEREHCCDDLVVEVLQDRLSYARALAFMEQKRSLPMALTLAASGGSLLQRIQRILGFGPQEPPCRKSLFSFLGAGLLVLVLWVGWVWQVHLNGVADADLFTLLLKNYDYHQLYFAEEVQRHRDRLNWAHDSAGRTLLDVAAEAGYPNESLLLLLAGTNPNLRDEDGRTALYYAVEDPSYNRDMIRDFLLLRGAQVNIRDAKGTTPLMEAVNHGNLKSIQILLRQGAQLDPAVVPADQQPLALAEKRGDPAILNFLETEEAQPHFEPEAGNGGTAAPGLEDAFTEAAYAGDLRMMENLLAEGADLNGRDGKGRTALIQAISHQQEDAVVYLLLLGADPNVLSGHGWPPMSWTFGWFGATSDYMRMALIAAGARTDMALKDGTNLLVDACLRENEHATQWMIWTGNDPSKACAKGTPMRLASEKGLDRIVQLLQRNGVTEKPYFDPSPRWQMMSAVKSGDLQKVQQLLKAGTPVDLPLDEKGDSGLMVAIQYRRVDVARLLLHQGANPNFQNKDGDTVLHVSVGWRFQEMEDFREELLRFGANPNLPNKQGITPFIEACQYGDLAPKITQMVQHGANINFRDKGGHTALYYAQRSGRNEAADYLLQLNAIQ